jgi:precorrin-6B methylase 2
MYMYVYGHPRFTEVRRVIAVDNQKEITKLIKRNVWTANHKDKEIYEYTLKQRQHIIQ